MNSARRSHQKTRSGCRNCKKRKIKCDEAKPSCRNCTKHAVVCDYVSPFLSETQPSEKIYSEHGMNNSTASPRRRRREASSPYQSSSSSRTEAIPLSLSMLDLELMHNYSTSTCFTLSSNPLLKSCWRINVPQLGFSCNFVMRSILALSALHIAHFKKETRDVYVAQAVHHQQNALEEAISVFPRVTHENCNELYIFSAITCVYALGSPRKPNDFLLVEENGIADWLYLLRGTRSIINMANDALLKGILGPMFISGKRRSQLRDRSSTEINRLGELRNFILETVNDETAVSVYQGAIHELELSLSVAYDPNLKAYEPTDAFIWPFCISDEYLELLKGQTQEALAVFAFFCVLLKRLDSYWFLEGWSAHLISRIHSLLDEEHRLWIQWPVEEIGWVPF